MSNQVKELELSIDALMVKIKVRCHSVYQEKKTSQNPVGITVRFAPLVLMGHINPS